MEEKGLKSVLNYNIKLNRSLLKNDRYVLEIQPIENRGEYI